MDPKETTAASEKPSGAAACGRYAAQPCSAPWRIWIVCGHTDEYGDVYLTDYVGQSEAEARMKVFSGMMREGFRGTVPERLKELRWRIVECELHPVKQNPTLHRGGISLNETGGKADE